MADLINPANLLSKVAGSKALKADDAAYQTIVAIISFLGQNNTTINQNITNAQSNVDVINVFVGVIKNITMFTAADERATIPASLQLIAGALSSLSTPAVGQREIDVDIPHPFIV